MIAAEKEKAIEINDTDDQQVDNDEATVIVNETLVEIQKEQVLTQEQGREMVEKQVNIEVPSSSKTTEGKDIDIQEKYQQIKEINEEIKREVYSQFLK